jgi:hypothetical protein
VTVSTSQSNLKTETKNQKPQPKKFFSCVCTGFHALHVSQEAFTASHFFSFFLLVFGSRAPGGDHYLISVGLFIFSLILKKVNVERET